MFLICVIKINVIRNIYLFIYYLLSPFILFSSVSSSSIILYAREYSVLFIDIAHEIDCCKFSQSSLFFFQEINNFKSCGVNLIRVSILMYLQ